MPLRKERRTIDLSYVLFFTMTAHFGPSLFNFMDRRNLVDAKMSQLDIFEFLKLMIAERKNDSCFFSVSEPSDLYNLEMSMTGRQSVIHGYFDEISKHWITYLMAWIEVLKMVDDRTAAEKVKSILEKLISKKKTPLDVEVSSFTAPTFLNRGNRPPRPGDMSKTEYFASTMITLNLYRCMTKFLGPVLRDRQLEREGQVRTDSEIDTQNLLFDLLDEWRVNNGNRPDFQADIAKIETARQGRNKICHGDLAMIVQHWKRYFHSWIDVCTMLGEDTSAHKVEKVYNRLLSYREHAIR